MAINFLLQKFSTLTIAKSTTSARTDITLQTTVKYLGAFTSRSALIPDSRLDNSNIKLTGNV